MNVTIRKINVQMQSSLMHNFQMLPFQRRIKRKKLNDDPEAISILYEIVILTFISKFYI